MTLTHTWLSKSPVLALVDVAFHKHMVMASLSTNVRISSMENNQKKKYVRADTRTVLDLQAEKNGVKVKPKLRKQNEAFPHYTQK